MKDLKNYLNESSKGKNMNLYLVMMMNLKDTLYILLEH